MRTLILFSLLLSSPVFADPYYTIQESGTSNTLRSITFINENTGFSVGTSSTLLRTSNEGTNWIEVDISSSSTIYNCVLFANSSTGFVVSDAGELIKSTNGGLNWQINQLSSNALKCIYFINETTGFTGGGNGTLYKTTNTGANWTDVSLSIGETINKIAFSDDDYGYFLTREFFIDGSVYKTTNGGVNWEIVSNFFNGYNGNRALFDVVPLNRDTVYVSLGYYQTGIMRTIDGGQSWQYIYNQFSQGNFPGSFYELFINDGYIYAICGATDGVTGYMVKSSNGGFNFSHYTAFRLVGYVFDAYFFKSSPVVYTCGEGGYIVKFNNYLTNVNNSSNTMPGEFHLSQNYPNPFNPTTSIKFKVKSAKKVKLIVLDVMGREAAKLVDQELLPGEYAYEFDGSKLSSGVYFYRLEAGDFVSTKRMMLVK